MARLGGPFFLAATRVDEIFISELAMVESDFLPQLKYSYMNVKKQRHDGLNGNMKKIFRCCAIALLLFGWMPFAAAQSVDAVKQLAVEIDQLEAQFDAASGEAAASLRQRIWTQRENYREVLWGFARKVDREQAPDNYAQAKAFLVQESLDIRRELEGLVQSIRRLSLEQATVDEESWQERVRDGRLLQESYDSLLGALLKNALVKSQLQLPSADDLSFVTLLMYQRANGLAGSIELDRRRRESLALDIEEFDSASDDYKTVERQLLRLDTKLKAAAADLSKVAGLLESTGEDVAEYREMEVLATGNLSTKLFDSEVAGSIFSRWWQGFRAKFIKEGPDLLTRLVVALMIIILFWFLARLVKAIMGRVLTKASPTLSKLSHDFLRGFSAKIVFLIGLLIAVSQLGIKIGPLLAGLGIMGFIVGFALQNTLSNFASGIMILIYRPFDVGDYVGVADVEGEVRRMNLVSTTIHTSQNHRLIIPNNKIWDNIIRNITSQKMRRVDLSVGVSYSDDVEKVEQLLLQIVGDHDLVKRIPAPVVRLHNLNESAVEFTVRVWAKSENYSTVFWDLTRQIKLDFDANGITFPFPQRELHMTKHDALAKNDANHD